MASRSIQANSDLHNLNPRCTNRCQPDLTAIHTLLARGQRSNATVPVMQYGNFAATASSDPNLTELVYQVRKDPVSYLDVSVELQ